MEQVYQQCNLALKIACVLYSAWIAFIRQSRQDMKSNYSGLINNGLLFRIAFQTRFHRLRPSHEMR